jgi:hypothetical protein
VINNARIEDAMKEAALLSIPVVVAVVVVGDLAEAQQLKKVPRIGFLFGSPVSARSARIEPFRQGSSILVAAVLLVVAFIAEAQQPTKVPRIGIVSEVAVPAILDPRSRHSGKGYGTLVIWSYRTS